MFNTETKSTQVASLSLIGSRFMWKTQHFQKLKVDFHPLWEKVCYGRPESEGDNGCRVNKAKVMQHGLILKNYDSMD